MRRGFQRTGISCSVRRMRYHCRAIAAERRGSASSRGYNFGFACGSAGRLGIGSATLAAIEVICGDAAAMRAVGYKWSFAAMMRNPAGCRAVFGEGIIGTEVVTAMQAAPLALGPQGKALAGLYTCDCSPASS